MDSARIKTTAAGYNRCRNIVEITGSNSVSVIEARGILHIVIPCKCGDKRLADKYFERAKIQGITCGVCNTKVSSETLSSLIQDAFENAVPVDETVFTANPVKPEQLYRKEHPKSSARAAERIAKPEKLGPAMARALQLVTQNPGKTRNELDALAGDPKSGTVGKRCSDLADKYGLIKRGPERRCTVTGEIVQTWYPI
jgi:hypothetical protein